MQDVSAERPKLSRLPAAGIGVLLVASVWFVVQGWGLGRTPFHTKGEPREGILVQEIVRTGEWILPLRNGVEMPRKPPLFHWLGAAASQRHGTVDEFSVRLPSVLLSAASALTLFVSGAAVLGVRPALIAAVMLLTSFEWMRAATSARVDMTLAFGLTVSFAALMLQRIRPSRPWLILFYGGCAWATLAKGPVGLALPLLQVLLLTLIDRSFRFARQLHLLRGLLFVLAVGVAWYALATWIGGREFFSTQVLDENVLRFLGRSARSGHRHGAIYLSLTLAAGLLPWTLLLPWVGGSLWQSRGRLRGSDPLLFALVWTMMVFAFYLIPSSKRGVYLLPLYPSISLLLGWWTDALLRGHATSRGLGAIIAPLGWAIAALFGVVMSVCLFAAAGLNPLAVLADMTEAAVVLPKTVTNLISEHAVELASLSAAILLASMLAALASRAGRWGLAMAGLFLVSTFLAIATRQVVLPYVARHESRKAFVEHLRELVEPGNLFSRPGFDYGVVFYWGLPIPIYDGPLSATGPRNLLTSQGESLNADSTTPGQYEPVPMLDGGSAASAGHNVLLQRLTEPRS